MTETTEIIYFNGKRYNSIREMPPKVRKSYEQLERLLADTDADGIPDVFQPRSFSDLKTAVNLAMEVGKMRQVIGTDKSDATVMSVIRETNRGIYVNGKFYETPEDMPQDIFEIYDAAVNNTTDAPTDDNSDVWPDDINFNPQPHPVISEAKTPNESVDTTSRFFAVLLVALFFLGVVSVIAYLLYF